MWHPMVCRARPCGANRVNDLEYVRDYSEGMGTVVVAWRKSRQSSPL